MVQSSYGALFTDKIHTAIPLSYEGSGNIYVLSEDNVSKCTKNISVATLHFNTLKMYGHDPYIYI